MDLRQAQLRARALGMTRAELGDGMSADVEVADGVVRLVPLPEAKAPLDAASIAHRQEIVQQVASVMVAAQRAYLDGGDLVALSKYDVADRTGLDQNDVDRAVRGKLVDCARGRIQLDALLHAGPPQRSASDEVKEMIREIIAAEDPRARLTDEQIRQELVKRDVVMATDVVAKYRDHMKIPPSRKR